MTDQTQSLARPPAAQPRWLARVRTSPAVIDTAAAVQHYARRMDWAQERLARANPSASHLPADASGPESALLLARRPVARAIRLDGGDGEIGAAAVGAPRSDGQALGWPSTPGAVTAGPAQIEPTYAPSAASALATRLLRRADGIAPVPNRVPIPLERVPSSVVQRLGLQRRLTARGETLQPPTALGRPASAAVLRRARDGAAATGPAVRHLDHPGQGASPLLFQRPDASTGQSPAPSGGPPLPGRDRARAGPEPGQTDRVVIASIPSGTTADPGGAISGTAPGQPRPVAAIAATVSPAPDHDHATPASLLLSPDRPPARGPDGVLARTALDAGATAAVADVAARPLPHGADLPGHGLSPAVHHGPPRHQDEAPRPTFDPAGPGRASPEPPVSARVAQTKPLGSAAGRPDLILQRTALPGEPAGGQPAAGLDRAPAGTEPRQANAASAVHAPGLPGAVSVTALAPGGAVPGTAPGQPLAVGAGAATRSAALDHHHGTPGQTLPAPVAPAMPWGGAAQRPDLILRRTASPTEPPGTPGGQPAAGLDWAPASPGPRQTDAVAQVPGLPGAGSGTALELGGAVSGAAPGQSLPLARGRAAVLARSVHAGTAGTDPAAPIADAAASPLLLRSFDRTGPGSPVRAFHDGAPGPRGEVPGPALDPAGLRGASPGPIPSARVAQTLPLGSAAQRPDLILRRTAEPPEPPAAGFPGAPAGPLQVATGGAYPGPAVSAAAGHGVSTSGVAPGWPLPVGVNALTLARAPDAEGPLTHRSFDPQGGTLHWTGHRTGPAAGPAGAGLARSRELAADPAPEGPTMIWRVAGAAGAASGGVPGNAASAVASASMLARTPEAPTLNTSSTGAAPGSPSALAPAAVPAPDPSALAEQVARIIVRRLEIERERRGGNPWT